MPSAPTEPTNAEYAAAATLRAALRRFAHETSRVLRDYGLTSERYELLLAIRARSDANDMVTIAELATELQLAHSSLTQLARRTEDAGLLYRRVSSEDARVRYLVLTDAGAETLAGAVAALRPERQRLIALLRSPA